MMLNNIFKKYLAALAMLVCFSCLALAQTKRSFPLEIGDSAPALSYSKWMKGSPVTTFDTDRIYVVEFWATWCVPCRIAMPHLSELARKYRDKATFIGVDIWELTEDKPYTSATALVTKFVDDMGQKMDYNVIMDNDQQDMSRNWMKAAGQNGIPATFLIQDNKIIWIGLPKDLDRILGSVMQGTFDITSAKNEFLAKTAASPVSADKMTAVLAPIHDAIAAKDLKLAFQLIDKALPDQPELSLMLNDLKFSTILKYVGEQQALSFAKQWIAENSSAGYMVALTISKKTGLSKESYQFAANIIAEHLKRPKVLVPVLSHLLATCLNLAGDVSGAIFSEHRAVETAKSALAEGKWPGAIMESTVAEYELSLAGYRKLNR